MRMIYHKEQRSSRFRKSHKPAYSHFREETHDANTRDGARLNETN